MLRPVRTLILPGSCRGRVGALGRGPVCTGLAALLPGASLFIGTATLPAPGRRVRRSSRPSGMNRIRHAYDACRWFLASSLRSGDLTTTVMSATMGGLGARAAREPRRAWGRRRGWRRRAPARAGGRSATALSSHWGFATIALVRVARLVEPSPCRVHPQASSRLASGWAIARRSSRDRVGPADGVPHVGPRLDRAPQPGRRTPRGPGAPASESRYEFGRRSEADLGAAPDAGRARPTSS